MVDIKKMWIGVTRSLKTLVLIFLLSVPSWGHSEPYPQPFEGLFKYSGELQPVMKIEVERVVALSDAGKQRLQQLKSEGARCSHVQRMTYRCSKQSPLSEVELWARDRVEGLVVSDWIHFVDKPVSIEENANSETFKSWTVTQKVQMAHGEFLSFEWIWTPILEKFFFRDENLENVFINMTSDRKLFGQYSVHRTLNRNQYETHIIRVFYAKD